MWKPKAETTSPLELQLTLKSKSGKAFVYGFIANKLVNMKDKLRNSKTFLILIESKHTLLMN